MGYRGINQYDPSDVTPLSSRPRLLVLLLAVLAGVIFFGYAFLAMKTVGWAAWPLALLLCVLAGAAWQAGLAFLRPSRASRTHTESSEIVTTETPSPTSGTPTSP